eukprot:TRINITY_DN4374_c0_g1_i1.p1 TRINITY_DN4374_c0_g1~~TRINITY_DN4374_c0_g1_i1.p1  ORF type:complete len:556 (-),score=124.10 TRINITY_DN4374_c0_g1_i1:381-2048(-)
MSSPSSPTTYASSSYFGGASPSSLDASLEGSTSEDASARLLCGSKSHGAGPTSSAWSFLGMSGTVFRTVIILCACCCFCCCIVPFFLFGVLFMPAPGVVDPGPAESTLLGFTLRGADFTMDNYVKKLLPMADAGQAKDWKAAMRTYFNSFTSADEPMIGIGPGGNTKSYYGFKTCQEKLKNLGASLKAGTMERESELALGVFNNVLWPEVGRFTLGLTTPDHAIARPYMARLFDLGEGKADGWTRQSLEDLFTDYLKDVDGFSNRNFPSDRMPADLQRPTRDITDGWYISIMTLKVLHKVALDLEISDEEIKTLAASQTWMLLVASLPGRAASSLVVWETLGKATQEVRNNFMQKYREAIKKKWPKEHWSDEKLTLLASVVADVMVTAAVPSVPLAIDIMLGYILMKDKPAALKKVDFTKESTLHTMLMEAMRMHAPVTTLPTWVTHDDGKTWEHDTINLDRAMADESVFPEPDVFKMDRHNGHLSGMAWADDAIVHNDTANPESHRCPGMQLSQAMVLAFLKAFQKTGPWEVEDDAFQMTYYGTTGFTVKKKAS